jgi:hypothetical protein
MKNVKEETQQLNADPVAEATHEAVRERAYYIWLNAGRSDGRDLEHWFQAEEESRRDPSNQPT